MLSFHNPAGYSGIFCISYLKNTFPCFGCASSLMTQNAISRHSGRNLLLRSTKRASGRVRDQLRSDHENVVANYDILAYTSAAIVADGTCS